MYGILCLGPASLRTRGYVDKRGFPQKADSLLYQRRMG
jgi:hypothetical protein